MWVCGSNLWTTSCIQKVSDWFELTLRPYGTPEFTQDTRNEFVKDFSQEVIFDPTPSLHHGLRGVATLVLIWVPSVANSGVSVGGLMEKVRAVCDQRATWRSASGAREGKRPPPPPHGLYLDVVGGLCATLIWGVETKGNRRERDMWRIAWK
jgi:hypothetical protein